MQIEDLMTEDPTCCAPDTPLRKVAQAMAESDCGALPVIEKGGGRRLLGASSAPSPTATSWCVPWPSGNP